MTSRKKNLNSKTNARSSIINSIKLTISFKNIKIIKKKIRRLNRAHLVLPLAPPPLAVVVIKKRKRRAKLHS